MERNRFIFFQAGMILALAGVLFAFEWKTSLPSESGFNPGRIPIIEEDLVEITVQKRKQPEIPKPLLIKNIVVELNEIEIDEEILVIDAENNDGVLNDLNFRMEEEPDRESAEVQPFTVVEEMPSFPGGEKALFRFLGNSTTYPLIAQEANITGTVFVEFVIDPTGMVTQVKIIRGIGGGCDEEAARVIRIMPRWNPGKQRGRAVPVRMSIPVHFKLN